MPINVTCSECHYHFFVGDEYAGRPGRCPECSAVIHVPDADGPRPAEQSAEPDPYRARRRHDPFDDEFPSRRRRRDDSGGRHEDQERLDFDDRPRRFDPQTRADAWGRVYRGLGYVQIAVILYFFGQVLQMGFMLSRGGPKANPNALPDSGEIAVGIGGVVVMLAAGTFWCLGRLWGTRVPYLPARSWAKASFFMVLASVAC